MHLRNADVGTVDLSFGAGTSTLVLRCECGAMINADSEDELIQLTRLHFDEFHPDLNGNVPADAILAMAEQQEPILSGPRRADGLEAWTAEQKGR